MFSAMAVGTYDNSHLLPVDAVLVIDISNSMRTADPNRISQDAMNLFIDMLAEERDRVGIVAYAGRVEASVPMTAIYDQREFLRDFIDGLYYASWTDHGLGLLEAIDIMHQSHEYGRQSVIIFLTDGNLNVSPWGARTMHEAEHDITTALSLAQQHGFPIHTIGLNFDGELDSAAVDRIANATGGLSFETTDAEELPGIVSTIFSLMRFVPAIEYPSSAPSPEYIQETIYIPPEPTTTPANRRGILLMTVGIAAGFTALALALTGRQKRVFTGRLVLETGRRGQPPIYRNLIEYGRHTTLNILLGGNGCPAFDAVVIAPSPHAPSHLPQLLVKCRHKKITFVKDFIVQNSPIYLSPGTEMTVRLDDEGEQVHMRYVE